MRIQAIFLRCLLALMISVGALAPSQAAPSPKNPSILKIGVAKTDITPPDLRSGQAKVWLAGFDTGRAATAIHDPLEARTFILDDGHERIGYVVVDLIGLFYDDIDRIRQQAASLSPKLDLLVISSTHNHNGPDMLGIWGRHHLVSGVSSSYMDFLEKQILSSLKEANSHLVPVRLRAAQGAAPELMADTREPIIKDDVFDVFQFSDASSGHVVATVVDWGNHPETLGSQNTVLTSDFPHYTRDRLEAIFGGRAIYVTSSVGGLMTTLEVHLKDSSGRPIPDCSFEKAEAIGNALADKMAQALKKSGEDLKDTRLSFQTKTIFIPMKNPLFRLMAYLRVIHRQTYGSDGLPVRWIVGEDVKSEVDLIHWGNKIEIATIPGELFPELEKGLPADFNPNQGPDHASPYVVPQWVDRFLTAPYKVVFGLANDEVGYIVPECDFVFGDAFGRHKSGHYEESVSLGPKTAPVILRAVEELARQDQQRRVP